MLWAAHMRIWPWNHNLIIKINSLQIEWKEVTATVAAVPVAALITPPAAVVTHTDFFFYDYFLMVKCKSSSFVFPSDCRNFFCFFFSFVWRNWVYAKNLNVPHTQAYTSESYISFTYIAHEICSISDVLFFCRFLLNLLFIFGRIIILPRRAIYTRFDLQLLSAQTAIKNTI